MADNKIIVLNPSDIISESMIKINHNFETLVNDGSVFERKLALYTSQITEEINKLKSDNNRKSIEVIKNVDKLSDKINSISNSGDIQTMVNNAILNANYEISNFIAEKAGEQISKSLNGYAKKSDLNNISSAFTDFQADVEHRYASASMLVANSTYYKDENGFLVYKEGNPDDASGSSGYTTIEDYYTSVKSIVDPDNKGLTDPDVVNRLLARAEARFETISTEIAGITSTIGDGSAEVDILAQIEGENGEDIVSGIFLKADNMGSSIKLNADQLNFTGHNITLSSGEGTNDFRFQLSKNGLTVNTTNFKLDGSGNLTITGNITATSGSIGPLTVDQGLKIYDSSTKKPTAGFFGRGDIVQLFDEEENTYPVFLAGPQYLPELGGMKLHWEGSRFQVYNDGLVKASQVIITNDVYNSIINDFDKENVDCSPQYVELDAKDYRCFNIERNAPIYIDAKRGNNNSYYEEFGGSTFEFRFSNLLQNVIYTVAFKFKHQDGQECTHNHISMDDIGYDAYNKLGVVVLKVIDTDRNIEYVNRTTSWTATTYEIWKSQDTVSMGAIIDAYNGQYGSFQFMVTSNNEIRILNYYADWITFSYRYR